MSRRPARIIGALAVLLAVAAAGPATASAHPLGNFTTNHYLGVTVSPEAIDVDVVTDIAEIPALPLLRRLDTDGDSSLGTSERDGGRASLCAERSPEIRVTVDGSLLDLELVAAGLHERPGVGGLATIRLVCELSAPNPSTGASTLVVEDVGSPDTIGWSEIVVMGDGYHTQPADAGLDVAARLTSYPTDLLSAPLAERMATVTLEPGGPRLVSAPVPDAEPLEGAMQTPTPGLPATIPGGVAGEIPFLPNPGAMGPGSGLLGLLAAGIAGAGHALSPGHGKTIMAAYLVATRRRPRHALLLGAAVTVSHTIGVVVLGGIVLLASDILPAERLYPFLGAVSGMLVTGIGAWLLISHLRRRSGDRRHAHDHAHGHAHDHPQPHRAEDAPTLGIGGVLAIGVAGGLVPSTAALVLLLAAVAAGQPAFGLALAVAFGIGMATVLTGIGLAIVKGRERLGGRVIELARRLPASARLSGAAPIAIGVVVLVGGLLLTGQALSQTL